MDLQKCLSSYVGNEKKAWDALRQIARGFKVLHREGILHRDLKPANILVKNGELKLADFGLAKLTEDAGQQMEHTILGTHLYKSPQLIRHLAYSAKCDVWSLGIIFYELLFGVYPWPSCKNNYKNDDEFLKAVREVLKLTNVETEASARDFGLKHHSSAKHACFRGAGPLVLGAGFRVCPARRRSKNAHALVQYCRSPEVAGD